MGIWRGKYLNSGPPRGPGHYSEDGGWWWDDGHQRWFRVTDQEDVLEIGAEDVGGTSLAASLLTTLASQHGKAYFRFVARARSTDPRWPTYAMARGDLPGHPTVAGGRRRPGGLAGDPTGTLRRAAPATARRGLAAGRAWPLLVVGHLPAAGPGLGHPCQRPSIPSHLTAPQAGTEV